MPVNGHMGCQGLPMLMPSPPLQACDCGGNIITCDLWTIDDLLALLVEFSCLNSREISCFKNHHVSCQASWPESRFNIQLGISLC